MGQRTSALSSMLLDPSPLAVELVILCAREGLAVLGARAVRGVVRANTREVNMAAIGEWGDVQLALSGDGGGCG
jgi:hypothetical protein